MGKATQGNHGVVNNLTGFANGIDLMSTTQMLLEGQSEKDIYETLGKIHAHVRYHLIAGAVPAVQIVFDLMLNPENSAQTRLMAALAVLDRAGHSTKTLHESEGMRNVTQNLNEMSSDDIMKALQSIQNKLDSTPVKEV